MGSFLEYILDSIYVFKVVDFIFFFFFFFLVFWFFFFFLVCTGWFSFCCVNNGTCNCVYRFDRFAHASYQNFRYWSKRSNTILLEWNSDSSYIYLCVYWNGYMDM